MAQLDSTLNRHTQQDLDQHRAPQCSSPSPKDTDAGAVFVLESKGNWAHAGYHLTAATAGPPLLSLPFAMAGLGWGPGVLALCMGAGVSFYACYLLSLVMDQLEAQGKRCLRYRDLAQHVVGPKWTYYLVAPLQFMVCFIAVVALILLGGQTLKAVCSGSNVGGHWKLYDFISIFGASTLLLSQLPSFHSLRHFNLLSMLLCIGFSMCAVIGSIIAGYSKKAPSKDYSVLGTPIHKMFAVFNSISIMISAYANPLIVEIQATLAPPVRGKMVKGLGICYTVALSTMFSVAFSGYWAFGNASDGVIFINMSELVPKWLYIMGNAFACLQLIMASVLYLQPTFEKYEGMVADVKRGRFSMRNCVPRLVGRSVFVGFATLLAAMLPFFADFNAFMGSVGFVPICIILPLLFYNWVFKTKIQSRMLAFWVNCLIIGASSIILVLGGIASVRQIVLDAKYYALFANV